MTTPLAPPDSSTLDATLARNWAFQVKIADTWTFVRSIMSFDPQIADALQDAGDYETGAWGAQISTGKDWTISVGVGRKLDENAAPDPGVEYLRDRGVGVGKDGLVEIRWWRTDGLPDAYQGRASVNFTSTGGDKRALQGATVTLTGYGRLNTISKPTAVAANEIQTAVILGAPTGGTFTLGFGGQTTAPLAYNAAAAAVQAALTALTSIGAGNVTVTGSAGQYLVTFTGALAAKDVSTLVGNGALLTGGTNMSVKTATLVTGAAGS